MSISNSNTSWLNQRILVSDAKYLEPKGINAFEDTSDQPDQAEAIREHTTALAAFEQAGITVERVASPADCQDGAFTANWGLTWNGRVLLSSLPNLRQAEEKSAETALRTLGFETERASKLFSGQGDAMIIGGDRVLVGDGYRTNAAMVGEIKDWLGLEPIIVKAKPKTDHSGKPVRNAVTGLTDSYFYDIDLAVAVIRPNLIAVCWDALMPEGQAAIRGLNDIEIIDVCETEAKDGLACNLVSTGQTVIMSIAAPNLTEQLRDRGLEVITLQNNELKKSGGGFRCISLSLYS